MSNSAPADLLFLLVCFVAECSICAVAGEFAARWLAGFSLWRKRLFEVSFLFGLAACSVTAYLAIVFSISARAIPVALALTGLSAWWLASGRRHQAALPGFLYSYLEFRSTRAFSFAASLVLLYTVLVGVYRVGWLLGVTSERGIAHGTSIWDDLRTLGFPLSLAAHGFPLRSPIAVEMILAYPLGAFLMSAGWIAWLPALALPILLAGTMTHALFYAVSVLLIAGVVASSSTARILIAASSLISVSFNLWHLSPNPSAWWLRLFFGYFLHNGQYTTIGWTPYSGMLWTANHALGFAAALLAAIWLAGTRRPGAPLLFAVFAATASMDMSVMAVAACGLLLAGSLLKAWIRRMAVPDWIGRGFAVWASCLVVIVLVNLPTLRGAVDSPFDTPFPWISMPTYNAGVLVSHAGPYGLLLLGGAVALLRQRIRWMNLWVIPVLTGLLFSFAFEYHSIWFWRFSFTAHLLLSILCAHQLELLPSPRAKRLYSLAWALFLLPGLSQGVKEVTAGVLFNRRSLEYVSAAEWIQGNTPISARVAEYRPDQASFAPDVNFLRTGNRGGWRIYDRSHPLVGYRSYEKNLSDLSAAIAWNDYLILDRSSGGPDAVLKQCGAAVAYANARFQIYRVDETCRSRLWIPPLRQQILRFQQQAILEVRMAKEGPEKLSDNLLAQYLIHHSESIYLLRPRLEQLWKQGRFADVNLLLQPLLAAHPGNAELRYSYAFTLHTGRIDSKKAVEQYDEALRLGYSEFWVRYNRGAARIELGQLDKARADLARAQSLDPKHPGVAVVLKRLADAREPRR